MEHYDRRFVCQLDHDFFDVGRGDSGELFDPTVDKKAFEAPDTLSDKRLQFSHIARNDSPIEAYINPTLPLCRLYLLFQTVHSCSRWYSIQWHINDRRNAPGCSGLRASPEPLPFGPARLIKMYVRIDESRKKNVGRVVDVWGSSRETRRL